MTGDREFENDPKRCVMQVIHQIRCEVGQNGDRNKHAYNKHEANYGDKTALYYRG
jgi:hypothetical protein